MIRIVRADAVLPGDREPIARGAVAFDETGRIVDVGPAAEVVGRTRGEVQTLKGVIFPGLVNAHTHIELSAMRGKVPGGTGFVNWVEHLLSVRADIDPENDADSIARAVDELVAFGTAAVGDVTNSLAAVEVLRSRGVTGWAFYEAFGVEASVAVARAQEVSAAIESEGSELRIAPAIHALYTTHLDAIRVLDAAVRERPMRTSLHLAEHASERRALESGDGPVADWLSKLLGDKTPAWPRKSPVAYADALGLLRPDVLLVHMADARPAEIALAHERGSPFVLCPRSNLYIELKLPPLVSILDAGVQPALGTDSLASNTSLDVLAEAAALHVRFPHVAPLLLLQMATWNGARVLDLPHLGRITVGGSPGLLHVECEVGSDPVASLLAAVKLPRAWIVRPDVRPVAL
jgi:cytosine/adenosine deaminase-related metal-dependent hydrolase